MSTPDRSRGCLLGLAVGDAVGTAVEFAPRESFPPVTDMTGGGPFGLPAGAWTDDTSMALCLAESLVECGGFDAADQMRRYVRWYREGYWSSTGRCFDIGLATRAALARFEASGDPLSGSPDPWSAGNGCIMRLAPVPIRYHADIDAAARHAEDSSRTTHAAPACLEASRLLAAQLVVALRGGSKDAVLAGHGQSGFAHAGIAAVAAGAYRAKGVDEIRGSGYVVESLEAALWCFATTDTFRAAVLAAANLGDDADTTAAVVGQVAGAFYGEAGIPAEWRRKVFLADDIRSLAHRLRTASV